MNSREISEVSIKLKSIINAVEGGALRDIASQLETAVMTPFGMYDGEVIGRMRNSRDAYGHFTIHTDDIESIKSVKAVINLLRSTDAATKILTKPIIDGIVENMNATSKLQTAKAVLFGVTGLASEYLAAKWTDATKRTVSETDGRPNAYNAPTQTTVDVGLRLVGDVQALKFYMGQLATLLPEFSNLGDEVKQTITRLQGALNETSAMAAATVVQEMSDNRNAVGGALDNINALAKKASMTGLERTLQAVRDAAVSGVTQEDQKKYYNAEQGKYDLPVKKKGDNSPPPSSQNMMIAYNLSARSGKTIARINEFMHAWNQTKEFPISQVPAMIELVNKVGKMVKDFQQLDNSELSQLIRQDMAKAIKEVLGAIGTNLPQLAAIAQEAELRIGLRDDYLLKNLKAIAEQFEPLAKKFDVPVTTRYPYPEQKNAVIKKMKGESLQRIRNLEAAKDYMSERERISSTYGNDLVPSLADIEHMLEHNATVRTPNGAAYQAAIQLLAKQITGMDALEIDINKAENKLYQLSQLPESEYTANLPEIEKKAVADLKELYAMRDEIQANIDSGGRWEMKHYASKKTGVGELRPGYAIKSMPKNFNAAAKEAAKDIDGLVNAEKKNIERLDELAAKNKGILGATNEVKTDRLRAIGTMRGTTIAETRGNIVAQRNSSREQGFARLQEKVKTKDDNDIFQAIIDRKRGPVLVQSEKNRTAMIEGAKSYLSDTQRNSLSNANKTDGIYPIQPGDGLLVVNIKQMSNTMTRLEKLMVRVNQATEYLTEGTEALGNLTFSFAGVMNAKSNVGGVRQVYAKVAELVPDLKEDIIKLLQEVQVANAALVALRESLGNTATGEMSKMLEGILEGINKNFPAKVLEILSDAQTEILSAIDPAYAEKAKQLFTEANNFIINVDNLVRRGDKPTIALPETKSPDAEATTVNKAKGVVNAMVSILQKKLEESPATKKRFGSQYDLSKLADGSPEKVMAGLTNALMSLNGSLDATVLISKTKGILGGGDLIANLFKMCVALKETSPSALAIIQPQIKALFETFEPVLSSLYASAAITEKTMGLREGAMTSSLADAAKQFQEQAAKFGLTLKDPSPFYAAQLALAQNEAKRLQEERAKPGANTALIDVQMQKITQIKTDLSTRLEGRNELVPARMGRS